MGVPKFYRWISERYPCLSEVVKEYQIPDFDNLYLDMNGIIHICSHPNDNDPHFRMTEEKMFKDIFHYIEVLFRLVQPKEVFFMAVDGVAPRAKMNQQRSRRFRSAREALDGEKKARERGEVLPTEKRFDSNCITPGTEFMVRLDKQLQYFVTSKISNDKMWQSCKVIYSGHQTPGEGEHKIMEFIRHSKSQPGYNANTRHCLYGLDADLMMLGLTSHEPHFSLLREEVRFGGKKDSSRTPTPEETTFHLLHLSLMREYINYEFYELKKTLPFKYNLENIIDDWVLMGFLVGNDFIPHLPHLHINKGALPTLYKTYKEVMPTLDGYLNDGGKLHLGRFEKFMNKLAEFDVEHFSELNADLQYMNGKRSKDGFRGRHQANQLEAFFGDEEEEEGAFGALEEDGLDNDEVRRRLEKLGLGGSMIEYDEEADNEESTFDAEFRQHKREYYMTKMDYANISKAELVDQAQCYVRGIQWILNYYYNGICSWSWFYPHHYSPYISDVKDFADMEMNFELGKPFMPFEQLLGVLPPLSMELLPETYRELMTSESSPLKKFYPDNFQTDLNGKMQDWEAVVLIPFIDEQQLLAAMKPCNEQLTAGEKARNCHGPMSIYQYTPDNLGEYLAPEYFPPVGVNHGGVTLKWREEWDLQPHQIYKGLCKGIDLNVYFAGFPSLRHIPHTFHIAKEGVRVFQQASRDENFILDIEDQDDITDLRTLASGVLGGVVFVSWPHLVEAKVHAVYSRREKYVVVNGEVQQCGVSGAESSFMHEDGIRSHYKDRWGVDIGHTQVLIDATPMTGRKYVTTAAGHLTLEREWADIIQPYAWQMVVRDLDVHDLGYKKYMTLQEYLPPRAHVFMLGHPHYGCMGEVLEIDPSHKGRVRVAMTVATEPNLEGVRQKSNQYEERYMSVNEACAKVGIPPSIMARITGTVFLAPPITNPLAEIEPRNKLNIGMNLKNNLKNEEVIGYTRKLVDSDRKQWLYSMKVVEALREYSTQFPEIFEYMSSHQAQKDVYQQDQVFNENYKERVAELQTWLKNSAFAKAERQCCGTRTLGERVTALIVDEVNKSQLVRSKIVKMQVRPHLLHKPNPLQGSTAPDRTVTYRLFDRVVNVREGYSVPLGAKGTVIGIPPSSKGDYVMYDVIFDEAFQGGLTLRGPESSQRCYRLHTAAMINVTHGARAAQNNGAAAQPTSNQWNQPLQQAWNSNQSSSFNRQSDRTSWGPGQRQERGGGGPGQRQDRNGGPGQRQDRNGGPDQRQDRNGGPDQRGERGMKARGEGSVTRAMAPHTQTGARTPQPVNGSQQGEPGSPQPPDPHQLPSPSGLRDASGALKPFVPQNVEIQSASEVECIVHGTYYSRWSKMKHVGIGRSPGYDGIACYPYVPTIYPGPKGYQLLVYLDVHAALADGLKFFRIGDKLVCPGDAQGVIPPKYFKQVVEKQNDTIIYPKNPSAGSKSGMRGVEQVDQGQRKEVLGRGRALAAQPPTGMQLYHNIWAQVQMNENEQLDQRPYQTQMLSQMLNINSNAPTPSQPTNGNEVDRGHANGGRKEVSVQDLFNGARMNSHNPIVPTNHPGGGDNQNNPNILSMLNAAHESFSRQHDSQRSKGDSPVKSAFVPTQVIRKQNPRKNIQEQQKKLNSALDNLESTELQLQQRQPQQPMKVSEAAATASVQATGGAAQKGGGVGRPKRHPRNRLAVNFNMAPVGSSSPDTEPRN